MESMIPILGVVLFLAYLANKLSKKEEESVNQHYDEVVAEMYNTTHNTEEMKQDNDTPKPDAQGLMFNTLIQLGCQPTANDDGTISVQYQGENFHMDFGGLKLNNVQASVVRNQKTPLLLGQSVLGRLGSIEIDNPAKK